MSSEKTHQPVLLNEVLDLLAIKPGGRYVDATLGLGGHALGILSGLGPDGRLLGLDMDQENLAQAKSRLQPFENQTITRRSNFRGLQEVLRELGWDGVDGMLFDLGISSAQLDHAARGFSFQQDGPLDMRLDPTAGLTALGLLKTIESERFVQELIRFGEGRFARKLSRAILHDVAAGKMNTTRDLAGLCERVAGWKRGSHPATRVFLCLRCLVNDELGVLSEILETAPEALRVGGRLAIISFHSLEDRLVKERFRALSQNDSSIKKFRLMTKKPVVPTESEARENPRSRSAKLRVLERVS